MRLLKILVFFFIVHYIRRFYQMYKAMKEIQREQEAKASTDQEQIKKNNTVEADFKVMDP